MHVRFNSSNVANMTCMNEKKNAVWVYMFELLCVYICTHACLCFVLTGSKSFKNSNSLLSITFGL